MKKLRGASSRRFTAAAVSAAMALVGLVAVGGSSVAASPAIKQAAVIGSFQRVLPTELSDWLNSKELASWPAGSPTAVVVDESSSFATEIAAPLARNLGVPMLTNANPTKLLADLATLKTNKVYLIGEHWTSRDTLRQQIASVIPDVTWPQLAGDPAAAAVGAAALFQGTRDEVFTADSSTPEYNQALATTANTQLKAPLLMSSPNFRTQAISEMQRLGVKHVYAVGGLAAGSTFGSDLSAAGITLLEITDATAGATTAKVNEVMTAHNQDTRKIYVVPSSKPKDMIKAAHVASLENAAPMFEDSNSTPSGPIVDNLRGWSSETQKLTVLSSNSDLSSTYEASALAAQGSRAASGAFNISSVSKGADGLSALSWTPMPGAATYMVFDLQGTTVYAGTSTKFTLPADQSTFKVRALNASGAILAERDLRASEGNAVADTGLRVVTTADASGVSLAWPETSTTPRPRKIVKIEIGRNPSGFLETAEAKSVGLTCGLNFRDASAADGKEWSYEVYQIGSVVDNICSSATPVVDGPRTEQQLLTGMRIPAVKPAAGNGSQFMINAAATQVAVAGEAAQAGAVSATAAYPTLVEQSLRNGATKAAASSIPGAEGVAPAAAQPILPWTFRYQTFIAAALVRPIWWHGQTFNGNNRWFDPTSPEYKTRTDATFYFNSSRQVTNVQFAKSVGETIQYNCPDIHSWNNCVVTDRRTASSAGISMSYQLYSPGSSFPWAHATIGHSVAIPFGVAGMLGAPGPPIDYGVVYSYFSNGFNVSGTHDGAPAHEIWAGYVPGEYIPIMLHYQQCDFAQGLFGFCSVKFSIKV